MHFEMISTFQFFDITILDNKCIHQIDYVHIS